MYIRKISRSFLKKDERDFSHYINFMNYASCGRIR